MGQQGDLSRLLTEFIEFLNASQNNTFLNVHLVDRD